ncbi:MAG: hypothetical protein RR086_02380 [Clostridia bacterium]
MKLQKKFVCALLICVSLLCSCAPQTPVECNHNYTHGVCSKCGAEKPVEDVKILYVGNSYTYYNDHLLVSSLNKLAKEAHYSTTIVELSNGSARLQDYLTGKYSVSLDDALNNNQFNYVFLQEHSTHPISNKTAFVNTVRDFQTKISKTQKNCQTIMYMTWARKDDEASQSAVKLTVVEMEQKLKEAYYEAADAINAVVCPVGTAFGLIRGDKEIELYNIDASHPSICGSYLTALTHYALLFDEDPRLIEYTVEGITSSQATKLKTAAYTAVKNAQKQN